MYMAPGESRMNAHLLLLITCLTRIVSEYSYIIDVRILRVYKLWLRAPEAVSPPVISSPRWEQ